MDRISTILIDHLDPGVRLHSNKYEIVSKLGQGGFGYTYLARHLEMDSILVIKEFYLNGYVKRKGKNLIPHLGSEELYSNKKEEFINEARTLNQLRHENIVVVHDVFQENNTAYYTMDYIKGSTLYDFVITERKRTGEKLPIDLLKGWLTQLSNGLMYIHDRNILHADISPMNILVNENKQLILIDFGQSMHYDANKLTRKLPILAHTRGYTAPEMDSKETMRQFHPQTDLFSFAAVMYFCLVGKHPNSLLPEDLHLGLTQKKSTSSIDEESILWEWIKVSTAYDYRQRPETIDASLKFLDDLLAPTPTAANQGNKVRKMIYGIAGASFLAIAGIIEWNFADRFDLSNYRFKAIPAQETYIDDMPMLVPAYQMGETEVSNKMYYGSTLRAALLGGNCDIAFNVKDSISIFEYCNELSKREGYKGFYQKSGDQYILLKNSNGYRLPLESEWRVAAGFPLGKPMEKELSELAWWGKNSNGTPHKVGQTARNAFGKQDLYGNMYELCHNPQGKLVCLGGCYKTNDINELLKLQPISISEVNPETIGFRLVLID